jgi:hypothetical protein
VKRIIWRAFLVFLLVLGACGRTVPGQPQEVKVTRGSDGLLISWKDTSSGDLQETAFIVKRDKAKIAEKDPNITQHVDTTADPTKTYVYQVCAVIDSKEVCSTEANYPDTSTGGEVTLKIFRDGTGNGVITSSPAGINCNHNTGVGCSATFAKGTTVTLTATPNATSSFLGFSENCTKTGANTCQIVMNGNKEVTESMFSGGPGLNVLLAGDSGAGVVVDLNTSNQTPPHQYINCGGDCNEPLPEGTIVVLEARPNPGAIFAGWKGCTSTTASRCNITLAKVSVLEASFFASTSVPTIKSFTATPTNIPAGGVEDVTLAWEIVAPNPEAVTALGLSDENGEVCTADTLDLVDSCVIDNVNVAAKYTLTVEGPFDPDLFREVSVSFGAEPTVDLTATPEKLATGEKAVLSWVVGGSTAGLSVTLDGGQFTDEDVTSDSDKQISVSPTVDTKYTITVRNDIGTATDEVTIEVGDKPVINSFEVSDDTILVGETSTLSWDVTPEDAVITFEPSIGTFTGNSKELSFPTAGVFTYTLTATNDFGSTESEPVVIRVGKAPRIVSFTATPDAIPSDGSVPAKLEWEVTGILPITLSINRGVGPVTGLTGSQEVTPASTTIYTLTATNIFGSTTGDVEVEVGPKPSFTSKLQAKDEDGNEITEILLGETIYFDWAVIDADSVSIVPTVDELGSSTAKDKPSTKGSKTYTLTAKNRFGSSDGGSVTINVK